MNEATFFLNQYVTTVISSYRDLTPQIRLLELADPDNWELPPFEAGAHIDVVISPEIVRQYSLCSNPRDRRRYFIAVQREDSGRGGSLQIHHGFRVGSIVPVSLPRNLFPFANSASHSILIAGGIGLTPFMSMVPELLANETSFHLHVCTRSRSSTPFLAQLDALAARGLVSFHHTAEPDGSGRIDLIKILGFWQETTHVYFCGPKSLFDGFLEATKIWPAETVHYEHFGAVPIVGGTSYSIFLERSKRKIEVAAGETMADALKRHGVGVKTACESGICGMCKTGYLAGEPDHRDHTLSQDERKRCLIPCVSGSRGAEIVLDI